MNANAYYRVTDGPMLDAIKQRISQMKKLREVALAFAEKHGASQVFTSEFPEIHISGLLFDGQAPEGWTKPKKNGFSRPKRGTDAHAEIESLMTIPSDTAIVQEITNIPLGLSYKGNGISGSTMLGHPAGPCDLLYWPKYDLYGFVAPDIAHYLKEYTDQRYTITNGADKWSMDVPGVTQISKEEWDHLISGAKLQEKNSKSSAQGG